MISGALTLVIFWLLGDYMHKKNLPLYRFSVEFLIKKEVYTLSTKQYILYYNNSIQLSDIVVPC